MIRDNSQRAKNAILLFWIFFGLTVISIGSSFLERNLLLSAAEGNITTDEATSNDLRQRIVGISELLVHIIVIVYFIMWFRRAYFNLHSLGFYLRYTEGWAAGAWFVPFMNLYAPFKIMKEIWDNTQMRAQQGSEDIALKPSTLLGVWWFLWIVTNVAGNIYTRLALRGEHDISGLISLNTTSIVLDVIDLANVFVIITIIQQVSGFEDQLKQKLIIENIASEEYLPAAQNR
jgi:hypothetical protein